MTHPRHRRYHIIALVPPNLTKATSNLTLPIPIPLNHNLNPNPACPPLRLQLYDLQQKTRKTLLHISLHAHDTFAIFFLPHFPVVGVVEIHPQDREGLQRDVADGADVVEEGVDVGAGVQAEGM